jgi:hypothetical protein
MALRKPPSRREIKRKLLEAISILKDLGFSGKQSNESSAYVFLALLGLQPNQAWSAANAPLIGITPIVEFLRNAYGVKYAPNTRETIRDESVKYYVESGMLVRNPDMPSRPVNSAKTVYRIETNALELFRSFGTELWEGKLAGYLAARESIRSELVRHRELARIPVTIGSGITVSLSPGGQNPLIKNVIENFCSRFTPGAEILYIGDAEGKFLQYEKRQLYELGIEIDAPEKMPDVVAYYSAKNWLVLIEAVTSAGPVDGKRRFELKKLFKGAKAGLVFVTAFETKAALRSFLGQISWETEVWIADNPDHLIHFDGERFLGPYPDVMADGSE